MTLGYIEIIYHKPQETTHRSVPEYTVNFNSISERNMILKANVE